MKSSAQLYSSVMFVMVLTFSFCFCNLYSTPFAREQPKVLTRKKVVCVFFAKKSQMKYCYFPADNSF